MTRPDTARHSVGQVREMAKGGQFRGPTHRRVHGDDRRLAAGFAEVGQVAELV